MGFLILKDFRIKPIYFVTILLCNLIFFSPSQARDVIISDRHTDIGLSLREFFDLQRDLLKEMHAKGEVTRAEAHKAMKGLIALYGIYYGCSLRNLDRVTFDECLFKMPADTVPSNALVRDTESGGGVSASDWGKYALGAVGGKIVDRVLDKVMDHTERKFNERVERDRINNENNRRAERERSRRCDHSTPSIRDGNCA